LPWRELEHPADIRLEIEAESLEELVEECARGFYWVSAGHSFDGSFYGNPGNISISAAPGDVEGLLVSWMNELLFNLETARQAFLPAEVVIDLTKGVLIVKGQWVPASGQGSRVKAVTYGGVEFSTTPRPRLRVIMDV